MLTNAICGPFSLHVAGTPRIRNIELVREYRDYCLRAKHWSMHSIGLLDHSFVACGVSIRCAKEFWLEEYSPCAPWKFEVTDLGHRPRPQDGPRGGRALHTASMEIFMSNLHSTPCGRSSWWFRFPPTGQSSRYGSGRRFAGSLEALRVSRPEAVGLARTNERKRNSVQRKKSAPLSGITHPSSVECSSRASGSDCG